MSAALHRLANHIAIYEMHNGEGISEIDRLAAFAEAHELDLEDTATLFTVAAGGITSDEAVARWQTP